MIINSGAPFESIDCIIHVKWKGCTFFYVLIVLICFHIVLMCWCQKLFLKNKKKLFWCISKQKTLWTATATTIPNRPSRPETWLKPCSLKFFKTKLLNFFFNVFWSFWCVDFKNDF
jgi:hypothetical protein